MCGDSDLREGWISLHVTHLDVTLERGGGRDVGGDNEAVLPSLREESGPTSSLPVVYGALAVPCVCFL